MARFKTFKTYRCGGYSSYDGHCGATDCETCHPGGARAEALEDATSELRGLLEDLEDKLAAVEEKMADIDDEESSAWKALNVECENLQREIDEVSSDIADIENGFDDHDDYDDYDRDDYYDDGNAEVEWESPY